MYFNRMLEIHSGKWELLGRIALISEVIEERENKVENDVTEKREILECEDTQEKSDTDQNSILISPKTSTIKASEQKIQVICSENLTL